MRRGGRAARGGGGGIAGLTRRRPECIGRLARAAVVTPALVLAASVAGCGIEDDGSGEAGGAAGAPVLAPARPDGQRDAGGPVAIGDDSLRVVFWPEDRALAERAWRAASSPFHLPGLPDGASRISGTIFLAPTPAAYDSLTRGAPGWSAGVAIPSLRRIIVPAFQSSRTPLGDPISALRHEIAHLALHAYLPGNIPRWFDEGYATWASGEWDEGAGWQIRLALLRGDAPLLDSLRLDWPRMAARARLAYLLSASAVHHLASRGSGEPAFTAFLGAWRREGGFEPALRSVYLLTPGQLERDWRVMVRRRYGWLLALSQTAVFWLVITLLFVVLGSARRRHDRGRLEALREQDRLLPQPDPSSYADIGDEPYAPPPATDGEAAPRDPDHGPSSGSTGVDPNRPQP